MCIFAFLKLTDYFLMKRFLLFLAFLVTFLSVFAQGIDFQLRDNYLPDNIDSANCVIYPDGNTWDVKIGWSSEPIISNLNIPLVGDLNGDGVPEIVCCTKNGDITAHPYRYNNEFIVYDGFTKHVKARITLPVEQKITANDAAAYGLIKLSDGKGLIVVACGDYMLRAFDILKANYNEPYWVSDVPYGSEFADWAVNVSFADFNSDGIPEVYVRNKIYNAETGVLLAQADGSNTGSSYGHWSHGKHYKLSSPLAANVLGDDNLELILGNKIYSVQINNPDGQSSNSITLEKSLTPPDGVVEDGHAQVADFNSDGFLDVFISVRNTDESDGTVYGYVWDVHDDIVSTPFAINTSFSGKSIPMIGDIDNDDLIEVIIQSGAANTDQKVQTYKYNPDSRTFSYMWGLNVKENSYSNSITAFDFNQDGLLELIICDEEKLRIVNGSGKSHITHNDTVSFYVMETFPYEEVTIMQYPVIADVDDDGIAEIVSVGSDKLNFIESDGSLWAPARKVWNQYMYNVTNINNDLTITQHHFNNATPFVDPDGVVRHPFNNFLQQATTLDQYGRPFFAAPDVNVYDITMNDFVLKVEYRNDGDNILYGPYNITAFANEFGGEVLYTRNIDDNLPQFTDAVELIALDKNDLCGNHDLNSIVVAINCLDAGIVQDDVNHQECDTTNNIGIFDFSGISGASDTVFVHKKTCSSFTWFDSTFYESGTHIHIVNNEESCDSIYKLDLVIQDSLDFSILGLTDLIVSSGLWPGTYYYYIPDSLYLTDCDLEWTCSNPLWEITTTENKFKCRLVVMDTVTTTLTARANCEDVCTGSYSLTLRSSHIYDNDDEVNTDIYPNPTNTTLTIKGDRLRRVKFYNTAGQIVKKYYLELPLAEMIVDVRDLRRGVYIVEIETITDKVIKRVVIY